MNLESFAVVEWVGHDPLLVSVVPSNWLVKKRDKLYSHWPSTSVDDSIVKKRSPPEHNWPQYQVTLLGSAGD